MRYLDIEICIMMADIKRVKCHPPLKRIVTMRRLAMELLEEKEYKNSSLTAVYHKMYRAQSDGFLNPPKELVKVLLRVFNKGLHKPYVKYDDLVKL